MKEIIIQANEEGLRAIEALCDVALKAGGMQNLPPISKILCALKPLPPQSSVEPEDQEPKEES